MITRSLRPRGLVLLVWLGLNGGFSWAQNTPPPLFREAAEDAGLRFHHFTGATGEYYMPEIVGAGVALFDYDSDGDLDLYLVQGTILAPAKTLRDALFPPPTGWKEGNRLFKNLLAEKGKLEFVDVTETAGVGHVGYGMGAAVGDYDNDGYQDLYVTNFGSNVLYHNNGNSTFREVTREAGVDDPRWSSSAAWVDYDRDTYLDLFVVNYLDFTVKGNKDCRTSWGEPDYCAPSVYRPVTSRLFRNLGNGTFADVTGQAGIGAASGPGLGVVCGDLNGDGWPDIYVANDREANILWTNQGDGTFKDTALISGVAYNSQGVAQAGMGVTIGDYDNDGDEDLLVTNLTAEGCLLYRNDGKGNFDDVTVEVGLLQASSASTGFGARWLDYDNDGSLDLFMASGAVFAIRALAGSRYPYNQRNQLFHNEGNGRKFRETTADGGPAFELSEVSRGAAFGDIDNDGDIDIVVSNNNGPVRLFLNQADKLKRRHWLQVKLEAGKGNRFGVGSKVEVHRAGKTLLRRVGTDGSFASASDLNVHFGLGENPHVDKVVVQWPNGSRETWDKVETDRVVTLRQGSGQGPTNP